MTEATQVWGVTLTVDMARQVRKWRVEDDDTWRGVAWCAAEEWGTDYRGHQLFGRDLCRESARMLGENPEAEPWN